MFANIPLMIVPFLLYNLVLMGLIGPADGESWSYVVYTVAMMSGGVWTLSLGDLLIAFSLIILFVEIMKATRTSNASVVDHLLSTFVFVAFLLEFLLVAGAAHSVFFILLVITLVDVIAGFSVSIRAAGRDVNFS